MNVELTINETQRGKEYFGTFGCGKTKFEWRVICTIPLSGMQQEVDHRTARGENLNTPEVQDQLFRLELKQRSKMIKLPEKLFRPLLAYLVSRVSNFHDAPISSVWVEIAGGGPQISTPFLVTEQLEVEDSFGKLLFKKW